MIKLFVLAGVMISATYSIAQTSPSKNIHHSFTLPKDAGEDLNETAIEWLADVKAEDILKKALEAYGGEKAMAALKDIQMDGTVNVMGQTLEYNQKNVFPGGFTTTVSMAGTQMMKQSKKDTAYEMQMPGGAGIGEIDDAAKEEIDTRAAFFSERYMLANPNYTYTLKGTEQVAGKDAYVITIKSPKGSESTVYYDVESGLKVQEKRESASPMGGQMSITSNFTEYKTFEGLKLPTKITVDLGQFTQDIVISDVKVNQGLQMSDL